jgi:hypothetical protein
MPESDHTVLQDIAKTSASLAALHEQARRSKTSRLSLEAIEAEITAVRAENTAGMGHDKP